ncbi:MAG: DUF2188 domain-containing protein [Kiritimatiellales bacterium]
MARKEHHVVHNSEGGWDVKKKGGERSSYHGETKFDAVERAREISRNSGSELIIHKLDGTIQNADSHGHDPCPPKDKK